MNEQIKFKQWIIERATHWHKTGKTSDKAFKQCMKNAKAKL